MENLAQRKAVLLAELTMKKLKNTCSSRKTNYKKAAREKGIDYADHVLAVCGVSIEVFEDPKWELPKRAKAGTAPDKNTPEWKEYKSVASRKTYTKQLMQYVTCCDPEVTTVEQFVEKHTSAGGVTEFYSSVWLNAKDDEGKRINNSPYTVKGYKFLEEFH